MAEQNLLGISERDLAAMLLILSKTGRWLVFVHQGHIVKVARVEPEQVVEAIALDNVPTPWYNA